MVTVKIFLPYENLTFIHSDQLLSQGAHKNYMKLTSGLLWGDQRYIRFWLQSSKDKQLEFDRALAVLLDRELRQLA